MEGREREKEDKKRGKERDFYYDDMREVEGPGRCILEGVFCVFLFAWFLLFAFSSLSLGVWKIGFGRRDVSFVCFFVFCCFVFDCFDVLFFLSLGSLHLCGFVYYGDVGCFLLFLFKIVIVGWYFPCFSSPVDINHELELIYFTQTSKQEPRLGQFTGISR